MIGTILIEHKTNNAELNEVNENNKKCNNEKKNNTYWTSPKSQSVLYYHYERENKRYKNQRKTP